MSHSRSHPHPHSHSESGAHTHSHHQTDSRHMQQAVGEDESNGSEWDGLSSAEKERRYFEETLKSFYVYRRYHLSANHSRRMNYLTLPKSQRLLLDKVGFRKKLDDVDHGIRMNADFLEEIAASGGMPFAVGNDLSTEDAGMDENAQTSSRSSHQGPSRPASTGPAMSEERKRAHQAQMDGTQDRIRTTLRQFVRDWSKEGEPERDACYRPCVEALEMWYPDVDSRQDIKVLVPGAGLGRLALEIAAKGFASQGNEFNAHMLIASNFALNETTATEEFSIYPYLHSFSNHLSTEANLLREIKIPDILPSSVLAPGANFSYVAGDWEEVYGGRREDGSWEPIPEQEGAWGAVVTCFFIDCARNIINFLKIIHKLLKEDGVWINTGPCLWHYENSVDKLRGEGSIELSLDELKLLALEMGFEIQNEAFSRSTYAADRESMLRSEYQTAFWTARKVGPLSQGLDAMVENAEEATPAHDETEQGLDSEEYDVMISGTGLPESIIAAACAKNGLRVLHLDTETYYGDRHASLTIEELVTWCEQRPTAASSKSSFFGAKFFAANDKIRQSSRNYALSRYPSVLPSTGPLIDMLINGDVGKYVNFRMVDVVLVAETPAIVPTVSASVSLRRVPGSKEQIFKDTSLSLMDKRKLMKFLMDVARSSEHNDSSVKTTENASAESFLSHMKTVYKLPEHLARHIAYAIAFSPDEDETASAAVGRMQRYLRSAGRYGPSPFLVAQFGGVGEIVQAFCRSCAVHGGTYILGPAGHVTDLQIEKQGSRDDVATFTIPAHPRGRISAKHVVLGDSAEARHFLSGTKETPMPTQGERVLANLVAILPRLPSSVSEALRTPKTELEDSTQAEDDQIGDMDVAMIVFPPEGERKTVVRALLMGEGTGSCPLGQYVMYLQGDSAYDANDGVIPTSLQTIMSALLGSESSQQPLFVASYHSRLETSDANLLPQHWTEYKTLHLLHDRTLPGSSDQTSMSTSTTASPTGANMSSSTVSPGGERSALPHSLEWLEGLDTMAQAASGCLDEIMPGVSPFKKPGEEADDDEGDGDDGMEGNLQ